MSVSLIRIELQIRLPIVSSLNPKVFVTCFETGKVDASDSASAFVSE